MSIHKTAIAAACLILSGTSLAATTPTASKPRCFPGSSLFVPGNLFRDPPAFWRLDFGICF